MNYLLFLHQLSSGGLFEFMASALISVWRESPARGRVILRIFDDVEGRATARERMRKWSQLSSGL